jgi:hypothetical protein
MVLDTSHFECEAYREVLFRFSAQKTLEQTVLIILPNELISIFAGILKKEQHFSLIFFA